MLQLTGGAIVEANVNYNTAMTGGYVPTQTTNVIQNMDYYYQQWPYRQTIYWNSYPVYICTDKTKKAIEVLKALQAEKLLKCDSVMRFIELVEKISGIL